MNSVTPEDLRQLADMIERGDAYASSHVTYETGDRYEHFEGDLRGYRREFRRVDNDRTLTFEVHLKGPIQWRHHITGEWITL